MSNSLAIQDQAPIPFPRQAENDQQAIRLWLHSKSARTQVEYRRDVGRFLDFTGKPLAWITLQDCQDYADSLKADFKPRSQARMLAAVKSLLSFCQKIGYLQFNVGAAVQAPKHKEDLAARILSEEQVYCMISMEMNLRSKVLLRVLYALGLRVSELVGLSWENFSSNGDGATVAVFGKGGKTRHVFVPAKLWAEIQTLRQGEGGGPVFLSRQAGRLSKSQAWRVVKSAAKRANCPAGTSPHWLRHACASHSLDRGAPIHVVQSTLGHASLGTTSIYVHIRPGESCANYLS